MEQSERAKIKTKISTALQYSKVVCSAHALTSTSDAHVHPQCYHSDKPLWQLC